MEDNKHYRMYIFVERHLSSLDKGIQAAHAIVEYSNKYSNTEEYRKWSLFDKTLILLNGDTVLDLENILQELDENEINYSVFKEKDLNNVPTAIAVIVGDNVYNQEDLNDYTCHLITEEQNKLLELGQEEFVKYAEEKWLKIMGGNKNKLIFNLLKSKHLAR